VQGEQLVLQLHVAVAQRVRLQIAEVACVAHIGAVFSTTCAHSAKECAHEYAPASKLARTVSGIERVPVAASAHAALAQITQRVYVKAVLAVGLEPRDCRAHADGVVGCPGLHEHDRATHAGVAAVGGGRAQDGYSRVGGEGGGREQLGLLLMVQLLEYAGGKLDA
jgi:hypothetical protein